MSNLFKKSVEKMKVGRVELPQVLKAEATNLLELKDQRNGTKSGYRLMFRLTDPMAHLSVAIAVTGENHKNPGTWIIDPRMTGIDHRNQVAETGHIWLREKPIKAGIQILHAVPVRPLVPFIEAVGESLKDKDEFTAACEAGYIQKAKSGTFQGDTFEPTLLCIPYADIPESMNELSVLSSIKKDGTVWFDASGNSFAFGTFGYGYQIFDQETRKTNLRFRGGNISRVGNAVNGTPNPKLINLFQDFLNKEQASFELKVGKLTVSRNETRSSRTRDFHNEVLGYKAPEQSKVSDKVDQVSNTPIEEEVLFDIIEE